MMWTRNLWTAYFIIWMFLAPSKPCMQTELHLEDFLCAYTSGLNWMRQISPDTGLFNMMSGEVVINLKTHCSRGLLYMSDKKMGCFWQVPLQLSGGYFSLENMYLYVFADLWIPTLCIRERKEREKKTKMTTTISPEGTFFQCFFLCQRWW